MFSAIGIILELVGLFGCRNRRARENASWVTVLSVLTFVAMIIIVISGGDTPAESQSVKSEAVVVGGSGVTARPRNKTLSSNKSAAKLGASRQQASKSQPPELSLRESLKAANLEITRLKRELGELETASKPEQNKKARNTAADNREKPSTLVNATRADAINATITYYDGHRIEISDVRLVYTFGAADKPPSGFQLYFPSHHVGTTLHVASTSNGVTRPSAILLRDIDRIAYDYLLNDVSTKQLQRQVTIHLNSGEKKRHFDIYFKALTKTRYTFQESLKLTARIVSGGDYQSKLNFSRGYFGLRVEASLPSRDRSRLVYQRRLRSAKQELLKKKSAELVKTIEFNP